MADWEVAEEKPINEPWTVAKEQKLRPGFGDIASDFGNYLKQAGEESWRTSKETAGAAASDLKDSLLPRQAASGEGFWEGYGKDLAALPGRAGKLARGVGAAAALPLAPVFGAAKSMIGRPLAKTIHSVGKVINPEEAAKHTPEDIYEDIRGDVESAIGTTGIGNASSKARPAMPTNGPKVPDAIVPTLAERKAAAKSAYQHPDVTSAEIRPIAVENLANVIEGDLVKQAYRPHNSSAPGTFHELQLMRPPKKAGGAPVMIADIDATRRSLSRLALQVDSTGSLTSEAGAAARAVSHIDDFLLNLNQSQLRSGNAGRIGPILKDARKDWASYKRGQLIDVLEANADASRASTYGGGNANNAIRQKFRPLTMNNFGRLKGWSPEAKDVFARVVSGGPQSSYANVTRGIGRFSPSGPTGLLSHMASLYGLGPAVAIPLAAGAYAAKKMGIKATRSNVEKVRDMLAKESALYRSRLLAQQSAQRSAVPTRANRSFIPPAMWPHIASHDRENPMGNPGMNPYAP